MSDTYVDNLIAAAEEFLVPLRVAEGFHEDKFRKLVLALQACKAQWAIVDSIPKRAVGVLVDLFPLTLGCSDTYSGLEADQVTKAAYDLDILVSDVVADENENSLTA